MYHEAPLLKSQKDVGDSIKAGATYHCSGSLATIKARVVNVVVTASLNQELDLDELGRLKEVIHDPEIYGGRVGYFTSPTSVGKVTLFPSGKMISVGTRTEVDAIDDLNRARDFLIKRGFIKPVELAYKTQNIVVVAQLGESVNLEEMAVGCNLIYEPEQFPAAILKITEPHRATMLIFASGKTVITGLKSPAQIEPVLNELVNKIKICKEGKSELVLRDKVARN